MRWVEFQSIFKELDTRVKLNIIKKTSKFKLEATFVFRHFLKAQSIFFSAIHHFHFRIILIFIETGT